MRKPNMTTIVRWNPLREIAAAQNTFDRVFAESWNAARNGGSRSASLALDVHETDQAYVISAVLPGINADAITISLHDDVLTIGGEVPQAAQENSRALLLERVYGKFQRSVRLPKPVDANAVDAHVENGVLTLTLPKTPEAQPRVIPVKTATPAPVAEG
jgi:HSP20 family protein